MADCLRLRHIVYVEGQGVPVEMEIDDHDHSDAVHFIGKVDGKCVATARICVFDKAAKIQRVAVDQAYRGAGFGRLIMLHMIDHIRKNKLGTQIILDAQSHLVPFYETLGFRSDGDEFDDAGIPHMHMVQPA